MCKWVQTHLESFWKLDEARMRTNTDGFSSCKILDIMGTFGSCFNHVFLELSNDGNLTATSSSNSSRKLCYHETFWNVSKNSRGAKGALRYTQWWLILGNLGRYWCCHRNHPTTIRLDHFHRVNWERKTSCKSSRIKFGTLHTRIRRKKSYYYW